MKIPIGTTKTGEPAGRPRSAPGSGRSRHAEGGYSMLLVVLFGALSLAILAGTLQWGTTNTSLNLRNNQYFRTIAAAEAATEKVLAAMAYDYKQYGDYGNFLHLEDYRRMIPTTAENPVWANYAFSDGQGQNNRTYVLYIPPTEFRVLSSQYRGLYGYASSYRIISNARELGGSFNLTAGVRQDIEVATIPLFQFAIFYNLDLEINPGPVMTVSGPVHGNANIYLQPHATLTFQSDVTAAGWIIHNKKPGDPSSRPQGTIIYRAEHDSQVSSLSLPIGTNNTAAAVRQVVEIPPAGESPSSPMGKERYYNKADLIIKVTDAGTTVTTGLGNNFATTIPASQYASWLKTTVTFFDKRENKTIKTVEIDVGELNQWNATNAYRSLMPYGDVRILYVADQRSQTSSTESGVRIVNGQTILPQGLTVATPNPLYIKGHYNCPNSALGTHNTSGTKPASFIADAINVLSTAWNDANSTLALSKRIASPTTVNAAFLAGIVETTTGQYSGGVENFPRFLEDWSSKTFTYNGSMVVMYPSRFATGLWRGTGSTIGIYNPPPRDWAFDLNFRDPNKLPPGTPQVRALIRGTWAMIRPNTTQVVTP